MQFGVRSTLCVFSTHTQVCVSKNFASKIAIQYIRLLEDERSIMGNFLY